MVCSIISRSINSNSTHLFDIAFHPKAKDALDAPAPPPTARDGARDPGSSAVIKRKEHVAIDIHYHLLTYCNLGELLS